jgi:hypothetical protein
VTDCPDAPVSLMAAVPVGEPEDPAGVTNTWNDGPPAGAGAQLKAQPMFHGATVVVKAVLVQFPFCWGESSSWRAGPAAAPPAVVAVVDPPATVVVVDPPAAAVVVVVDPPAAVVVVAEPPPGEVVVVLPPLEPEGVFAGGNVPDVVPVAVAVPPPVSPLIHIPRIAATMTAVRSCQVFQDRRSLILYSPGAGVWSAGTVDGSGSVIGQVEIPGVSALNCSERCAWA